MSKLNRQPGVSLYANKNAGLKEGFGGPNGDPEGKVPACGYQYVIKRRSKTDPLFEERSFFPGRSG